MTLTPDESRYYQARLKAAGMLGHYFSTSIIGAGLRWDGDNAAEMEQIIDAIVVAVKAALLMEAEGVAK